ncbi:hypothetical protein [Cellulosimicrobium sp. NPDC057862]|uniref:hypothetical protein n=1 Tax=Actinomycetes TaxID=1760 RepID=UPI00366F82A9
MTNDHSVFGGASRAADFEEEADATVRRVPAPPARREPEEQPAPVQVVEPLPAPPAVPAVVEAPVPAPEPLPEPPAPDPARRLAAAATTAAAATAETGPQRAQKGWRGALAKVGLPVAPGVAERAQREELAARTAAILDAQRVVRQATWTRAVAVLIGNPKGGTGKTPLALALGGIISAIRGGGVGIVEVADDPGALGFRAEGSPSLGLGEFVRDVAQLETRGQVVGYTAPQTSFASVIGTVVDRSREPLTYEAVTAVAAKIDEHFEVRVMDSGNQPSSGPFRGAVDTADVLVIPVMLAGDSTLEALGMLRELRRTEAGRRLADTAIAVVMDDGRPQAPHMAEAVRDELTAAGVRTFHQMPYEPHIAARGEVTLAELHQDSTEALTLLAADVIRALTLAAVPTGRRVQTVRPTTTQEQN